MSLLTCYTVLFVYSFLQSLDSTNLISVAAYYTKEKPNKASKKKGQSNKKSTTQCDSKSSTEIPSAASMDNSTTQYILSLTDSVFFPMGGGQPADRGTILVQVSSEMEEEKEESPPQLKLHVSDVQNHKGVCLIYCHPESSTPSKDLKWLTRNQETTPTRKHCLSIHQTLDWDRRFDLMTQHSAQHLLSAIAISDPFQIQTHTFSLQEDKLQSYIDFVISPTIEWDHNVETMKKIVQIANEKIRDNLSMTPTWLDPNDEQFQTRVRSRLLPSGFTGKVRLVEIEQGIDFNTCCGTHVPSLGHLQMIQSFRVVKVKPTIMRVYFASGKRLMRLMEENLDRQVQLTGLLSSTEEEIVGRVTQLLEEKRLKEKEIEVLNQKLCSTLAKSIASDCALNENLAIVDLGHVNMNFMMMLSKAALDLIDDDRILLLFLGGEEGDDSGQFLLTGTAALVDHVGKKVAETLCGRGGGKNGRFQGKGTKLRSSLEDVKRLLQEEINDIK